MQKWRGQELKPLRVGGKWTLEKLLARAEPDGDCLNWGSRKYGQVRYDGKNWGAHTLAYHFYTGEDTTGHQIHHKCANNRCINPKHLQLATQAENNLEMLARKSYVAQIAALEARVKELEALLNATGAVT